jgi:hypothetical protein
MNTRYTVDLTTFSVCTAYSVLLLHYSKTPALNDCRVVLTNDVGFCNRVNGRRLTPKTAANGYRVRWGEPQATPNIFKHSPLINNTQFIKSGLVLLVMFVLSHTCWGSFLTPAYSDPNILKLG